ncbi:anthranilate phosphoribosyltransferase TrpD [Gluconobacter thailandicus F149-1 = NBRC 100600]|uniref:Anthranilate phosphoribosyltransferase n=1 Tax=Gluconobacter thailandicus NBRC 3257 TaxID=1381097 RepID=A0ABQ0J0D2_GLUTH|nr:anthranilate phosphoribosyltransferase [Gluconobacter thailandicus]KXV52920.1 anthranilate phosphoribosyltransferase [Gluconobacter thailandicus]GAC86721.1 anthranilate phosphoribosyltransferase [Gluconobacter thailandicus NBRC 3255]GAD27907.1 anthranilate phosphoribosyltransferase [Gluconobacter thailandicus NBRC 3257]GAN91781.1 anthranilate phosphoribosyltransferase TrpD [Gluconobacter thailandicus F149-1 = NBRC 100600]GBR59683.1 anthranilate phosphoribosyltransferase [Gluconobacter thail
MTAEADFSALLRRVADGAVLTADDAEKAFSAIMAGDVEPAQLAAFLTALKMRGEAADELTGAVQAVRRYMTVLPDVPADTLDVCGTGGDGLGTLNVSTAVAFVLAGLGVSVAKHGNRALSSRSGATDVLEKLGVPPIDDPAFQSEQLRDNHLAFLAAPFHHPAMRHAAPVRKALGFRTLFNLLGPLCNPAQVQRQLIGVFDVRWCEPVARTLGSLGSTHVWAIHGTTDEGGSDELTLAGPAEIVSLENGTISRLSFDPDMAGVTSAPISAIRGGDSDANAQALTALLDGARGPYRDTVLLNSAAALHVAGRGNVVHNGTIDAEAFRNNMALAARSIDDGHARMALTRARNAMASLTKTNAGLS